MTIYLISVISAIVILALGEKLLGNQTKETYIKQGYNWSKVILYSNTIAIVSGLISAWLTFKYDISKNFNPQFIPFATTVVSYITIQTFMTDLRILLINRNILRTAYLSLIFISIYNVTTNEIFSINMIPLIMFVIIIIFLFLFSPIGASDVRALAVGIPYVTSIGGYLALELLLLSLILASLFMIIKREKIIIKKLKQKKIDYPEQYKEFGVMVFNRVQRKMIINEIKESNEMNTPVGPFMIVPFMIFLIAYPVLI